MGFQEISPGKLLNRFIGLRVFEAPAEVLRGLVLYVGIMDILAGGKKLSETREDCYKEAIRNVT